MVSIIAGERGSGKTKRLIKLAHERLKECGGYVVFIDDDERQMYELNREIRFVSTKEFPLANYRELVGFIYGILSQNSDIKEIFIDSLNNVIEKYDDEVLHKLIDRFNHISKTHDLNISFSMDGAAGTLPEKARELVL
jgi:KaiC/GvpD/RAD55 family RecA-like ATPase